MYTTVLFDLDGTLLDTLEDLAAAANHTLKVLEFPTHPVDAYKQMVGNGIPKLVERFLPDTNKGEATQQIAGYLFRSYYTAHAQDKTAPYPGVDDMLLRLRAEGVRLGVMSNKADENVRQVVTRYFPGSFAAVRGLVEGALPKPDPASTLQLMQQLAALPDKTLYVGDSDVDVYTAKNAGLPCAGVTWGFRGREELAAAGADFIVDAPQELLEIILR